MSAYRFSNGPLFKLIRKINLKMHENSVNLEEFTQEEYIQLVRTHGLIAIKKRSGNYLIELPEFGQALKKWGFPLRNTLIEYVYDILDITAKTTEDPELTAKLMEMQERYIRGDVIAVSGFHFKNPTADSKYNGHH